MSETTIERDAHSQQFVIVHNRVARDKQLSRAARGLLIELLSLPSHGRMTVETLVENGPEGRDAIRRMLRDLEAAGYIERHKEHAEGGRWRHRLVVHETPVTAQPAPVLASVVPPGKTRVHAGQTSDAFSGAGKGVAKDLKTEDLKDEDLKTLSRDRARLHRQLAAAVPGATERDLIGILDILKKRPAVQSAEAVLPGEIRNGNGPSLLAKARLLDSPDRATPSGLPDLCGFCDNRWTYDDQGRVKKCPTCHPDVARNRRPAWEYELDWNGNPLPDSNLGRLIEAGVVSWPLTADDKSLLAEQEAAAA